MTDTESTSLPAEVSSFHLIAVRFVVAELYIYTHGHMQFSNAPSHSKQARLPMLWHHSSTNGKEQPCFSNLGALLFLRLFLPHILDLPLLASRVVESSS